MRYTIAYDEDKECFTPEKLKSSKSAEYFKTKRIAKKYVAKLNKQALFLRLAANHIELTDSNPFDPTIIIADIEESE